METPTKYLTRAEAAQYLRVSVPQIDNLARRGDIPRAKFGNPNASRARVLYRREDLDTYFDANIEQTAEAFGEQ